MHPTSPSFSASSFPAYDGHYVTDSSHPFAHPSFPAILGTCPALLNVLERAARVARTRLAVLVTGESGTGKELLARGIHDLSEVACGPFVAVNCGALTRELAESELFGHERGAFTGATGRKTGWFEEASGGTLILDEVGELPLDLQPKLLRVLETGRLRRVGGQGEVAVNVRVVALTLRNLAEDAARKLFRIDLYHRLAGCELRLPPLRERRSDIPLLAERFLAEDVEELGQHALTPAAIARLMEHAWPGNVRELRNAVRRAAALSESVIDAAALDLIASPGGCPMLSDGDIAGAGASGDLAGLPCAMHELEQGDTLSLAGKSFQEMQAAIFRWALQRSRGSRRRAARALGISRSTFCDRVRRLGLMAGPSQG